MDCILFILDSGIRYLENILCDQMSFPSMTVTHDNFNKVRTSQPKDIERCTVNFKKWSMIDDTNISSIVTVKDKIILSAERNKYEEEWKNFAALPADMSSSNLEGDSKQPSKMRRIKMLNKFNILPTDKK